MPRDGATPALARPRRLGLRLTGRLALLAASMRAAGARVGVDELLGAHRALAAVDPADRSAAYFALRATLCSRHDDFAAFDAAFAELFAPPPRRAPELPEELEPAALALPRVAVPAEEVAVPAEGEADVVPPAWSDAELLREKDFADYTDAERAAGPPGDGAPGAPPGPPGPPAARAPLAAAARRRTPRVPTCAARSARRSARAAIPSSATGVSRRAAAPARPGLRRVGLDGAVRAHAAPVHAGLRRGAPARRGVRLRHAADARDGASSRGRDPDRALDRAAGAADDWSGGTRIGDALADAQSRARPPPGPRRHRRPALRRLGPRRAGTARAPRWRAYGAARTALIWLNPLKAHPGYEPLTRGMQAALPHVDHFLAGNSLSSLADLAELMEGGLG